MSAPAFKTWGSLARFAPKGPAAPQWLAAHGIALRAGAALVAVATGSAAA